MVRWRDMVERAELWDGELWDSKARNEEVRDDEVRTDDARCDEDREKGVCDGEVRDGGADMMVGRDKSGGPRHGGLACMQWHT